MTNQNKRGRKRNTEFYNTRYKIVGLNEKRTAEVLNVEIDQVLEWDLNDAPSHVIRYLLLWDKKQIGVPGWQGWMFSKGVLLYKGNRFRPESILRDRDFRNKLESDAFDIIKALKTKA
ncbi:hypothetical protein [Methylomonas sp. AM2-LC]|uniref:hypothetical protein n=1 Tax=Methylomonas sp. AM2-LC TaxID=3153301 RepID=UPI003266FB66